MSDNGSCYRSHRFRAACQRQRLRHIFTRPYTPRTKGEAERFIQTSLREWAYAAIYSHSAHRTAHLQSWLQTQVGDVLPVFFDIKLSQCRYCSLLDIGVRRLVLRTCP